MHRVPEEIAILSEGSYLFRMKWATHRETVQLSDRGFDRMRQLVEKPPAPNAALKAATARRKR